MTKQLQLRSRVKGQLSCTVLKTNGGGNKSVEFNPIRHRTRSKTHFGYQTGDIVKAVLPKGKFTGTHVGRLSVRKTGKFDLRRGDGLKVSPVNHKYCKAIHRNDGYTYSF